MLEQRVLLGYRTLSKIPTVRVKCLRLHRLFVPTKTSTTGLRLGGLSSLVESETGGRKSRGGI